MGSDIFWIFYSILNTFCSFFVIDNKLQAVIRNDTVYDKV